MWVQFKNYKYDKYLLQSVVRLSKMSCILQVFHHKLMLILLPYHYEDWPGKTLLRPILHYWLAIDYTYKFEYDCWIDYFWFSDVQGTFPLPNRTTEQKSGN